MIKERESNFELLRIVAIFIVILSHFNVFGGFPTATTLNTSFDSVLVNIFSIGSIANHIFIFITGYFMIKSKVNIKKIIGLILEMEFYSIAIFIFLLCLGQTTFNFRDLLKSFFPIFWGNWFLIYYILLTFIIPFLNKFIESIDIKKLRNLIIILFVIEILIPTFTNNSWNYTPHNYFILDYFIGAYLRLNFPKFLTKKNLVLSLIVLVFLSALSVVGLTYLGIIMDNNLFIHYSSYFLYNNHSIFVFGIALNLFLLFKLIKIKNNKIINYISKSVLGIYLIHMNYLLTPILWQVIFPNTMFFNTIYFIPFAIFKVLLVMILCLFIDKIRIALFGKIEIKLSSAIYNKIIYISDGINKFINLKRKKVNYE